VANFIQATSSITFKQQAELWLRSLANRKRNPVEETTIANRRYTLDKWIYPHLGSTYLADVNNLALKGFVEHLAAASLAPASIRDYTNIVKAVVASAIDENGEEKFPRKWNEEFIDAPIVTKQRQPTSTCQGITDMLAFASGQYRVLYALLAGCGPLRVGEALGLEIGKHISEDFRTLSIVQKAKAGEIQPYLKTKNGERQVDLSRALAEILREFVGERTSGLLFHTSTGAQLLQSNTLSDSLHPVLDYLAHERGGFNIFRRFRLTHLETCGCPDALKHFWSGHAQKHVSERYIKLSQDREFRLMWAEKIGLGFELPGASSGRLGQLLEFRKAV
jgi:integrase